MAEETQSLSMKDGNQIKENQTSNRVEEVKSECVDDAIKMDPLVRVLDTKIDISNISQIDTSSRTFVCAIEITMTWPMTKKEETAIKKLSSSDLHKYLSEEVCYPTLIAANAREIDYDGQFTFDPPVVIAPDRNEKGQLCFLTSQCLNGVWAMEKDRDELNDFPFDEEILFLDVQTKTAHTDRFRIYLSKKGDSPFKSKTLNIAPAESQQFECFVACVETAVYSNFQPGTYDGVLMVMITARRKWRYYLNQVVIFVFFQSLLLLPGYSIDVRDVGDRLAYIVTLLLAQTALLSFMSDSLPKLTYFSVLDEYILWNFVLTL
eukprot:504062_1